MSAKIIYESLSDKSPYLVQLWPDSRQLRSLPPKQQMERRKAYVAQAIQCVVQSARENTLLAACSPESIIGAVSQSIKLGFIPNGPDRKAHIVPYKSKQGVKAQFIIGFQGEVELVLRTGAVRNIYPVVVRNADYFSYQDFPRNLRHCRMEMAEFAEDEVREWIERRLDQCQEKNIDPHALKAAYSVIEYADGRSDFSEPLSGAAIAKRRNAARGNSSEYSPWNQWEEEMWKKTAIKSAVKYLPISVDDFERSGLAAAQMDQHVIAGSEVVDGNLVVRAESPYFPEESDVPDVEMDAPPKQSGLDKLVSAKKAVG